MEALTKRILAIVLIAAIGTGIGVGAWFFLGPGAAEVGWETPGVSGIPESNWIKVGYLGGLKGIQGAGGWNGAWLAAYDINTKDGGLQVGNETYYVAVKARDTNEHDPSIPISTGLAAAEKLIDVDGARYLFGGFRTEVTRAYVELAMNAQLMFFGAGCATDEFCDRVGTEYDKYQYYFRQTPIKSSKLALEIVQGFCHLINVMETQYGKNITNIAILREALDWTEGMSQLLNLWADFAGYTIVYEVPYPIASPDFESYWNLVESSGAQIAVPIVSGDTGITMMKQYAITQPDCAVFGIDVEGQMTTYWSTTGGACNGEIFMTTLAPGVDVAPYSATFYSDFETRFGYGPTIYTAPGTYDAVNTLVWAIDQKQSFAELDIIAQLETLNRSAGVWLSGPRAVAAPRLSYDAKHDVEEGYPWGTGKFAQWQDGTIKCIPTGEGTFYTKGTWMNPAWYGPYAIDFSNFSLGIYPDALATGSIVLPTVVN